MTATATCARCRGPLDGPGVHAGPEGVCPRCLLEAGRARRRPQEPRSAGLPAIHDLARRFPQLEIIEPIGHGGMGAVYKARQRDLDRYVALKIINPQLAGDPAFVERFAREARALARLSHPNIVTVYDFSARDDLCSITMEYVDGPNLRQVLEAGQLPARDALVLVPQICDALQFAHDQGVVHRDVKPENILVDSHSHVKIVDFGLAKLTATDDQLLTASHQVMGTPRYMAPEQMEASRGVDHRADIYSLGIVFYEMLTGELPMGLFDPPSKRVEVDVRLDSVVLKALQKEPDRRYQQAREVRSAVEELDSDRVASAGGETLASDARRRNDHAGVDRGSKAAGSSAAGSSAAAESRTAAGTDTRVLTDRTRRRLELGRRDPLTAEDVFGLLLCFGVLLLVGFGVDSTRSWWPLIGLFIPGAGAGACFGAPRSWWSLESLVSIVLLFCSLILIMYAMRYLGSAKPLLALIAFFGGFAMGMEEAKREEREKQGIREGELDDAAGGED